MSSDRFEENVDAASDLAASLLGAPPYINEQTTRFQPGHRARVTVVRSALHQLGLSVPEIGQALAIGETTVLDGIRIRRELELERQTSD
jgi:hypothetical protein